jgi:polar amino acid transport system ATP-binding protein
MNEQAIIRCQQLIPGHLPFEYHGDALDLDITRGEAVSIIGPDSSGKGNWLRTICGREAPQSGSVRIKGINTRSLSEQEWTLTRMKVAYLHQDIALLSAANGMANVLAPAFYHRLDKKTGDGVLAASALELLEEIDPDINLDDLPAYISKDHQFKIAVARALLLKPEVLALNNPFAHFKGDNKQRFKGFLKSRLEEGLSLLMVTQDIDYALALSDKIIFIDRKNILFFHSKQQVLNCDIPAVSRFIHHVAEQEHYL